MNICIVGGGVVGLSCAYHTAIKYPSSKITIIADKYYSETTTYGSGGLWKPYQITGTPDAQVNEWGKLAFEHFLELYRSGDRDEAGIRLLDAYDLYEENDELHEASWKDIVYNYRKLNAEDLNKMGLPCRFKKAITFSTLLAKAAEITFSAP